MYLCILMQMEITSRTGTLPVMEHFATLQGEGFHSGKSAYFIRTGGCDVGCHWCDVKESWDAKDHPELGIEAIVDASGLANSDIVVVTGGEPTMYDLAPLTRQLKAAGKQIHLETSGVYPLTGRWDWITFSPKKFKAPHPGIYKEAHELKVVIFHKSDLSFAEEHASLVSEDCKLFLQPEWSKRATMMPLIVEYIQRNPKWTISLQTHKYLNIP